LRLYIVLIVILVEPASERLYLFSNGCHFTEYSRGKFGQIYQQKPVLTKPRPIIHKKFTFFEKKFSEVHRL
jgi:hypothetical protein